MSQLQRVAKTLGGLLALLVLPLTVFGQINSTNSYTPQAGEYPTAGALPGDQTHSAIALNASGGFLVWQDNITDGDGLGISAVRLDSTLSPTLGNFRVNVNGVANQENPQVALLKNGGAVFVWQSGKTSFQHIMARFMGSNGLWLNTNDIQVNTATNYQVNPAVCVLTNGNVVVAWASYGQVTNGDGLQDIYGQILSPTGQKIGGEFRLNQFTPNNQRSPAIAALPNGNFMAAWVSELERAQMSTQGGYVTYPGGGIDTNLNSGAASSSVDIYARQFNSSGSAVGGEFPVNPNLNLCANPQIAVASDGSYMIVWSQKDLVTLNNSWDIWGRQFSSSGVGGVTETINTQLYGDQYIPKIAALGTDYLVVWTSMGQDGSMEGVFGQFLHRDGSKVGAEVRVNSTVLNSQMFPAVASDGVDHFLASWSSYVGGLNSLDLYAQRYAIAQAPLNAPAAPVVLALDPYSLSVTWPTIAGFNVSYYELFVDGSQTPVVTTNNMWSCLNYNPSSTHTFQLAYVLSNGTVSPLSPVATASTWGADKNFDGLPDDWEAKYFGSNQSNWPKSANTLLAPGVTVLDVFLWGGNPNDPSTWLRTSISQTPEGYFLNWNTVPGAIYQVETSTDLKMWTNLGSQRFEAGNTDSLYLGLSASGFYQVIRNRY